MEIVKKKLKFNHKEESINSLPLLFHSTSYSTHSRIHREIKFVFIYSLIFCWIRIRNNNSGSRQKFRIHADPDPQHCLNVSIFLTAKKQSFEFLFVVYHYVSESSLKSEFGVWTQSFLFPAEILNIFYFYVQLLNCKKMFERTVP